MPGASDVVNVDVGTNVSYDISSTTAIPFWRADVDIRYAAFRDLGRTNAAPTGSSNPIGRYPMHFHHLMGPIATPANGFQYTFVGNAIDGGSTNHQRRWSVAIHNTHYGLVSDNVAYNYAGALFTTEDGSESYNVIERNFAVRSHGSGGRLGDGNEGMGFWFRGPNNYVRGNVAAHFDSDDGNNMPILEFKNNEVYSSAQGLTYWWLSSQDPAASPNSQESVFEDLRIWHVYNAGVYHYPAAKVRFERLLVLGNDPASSACCKRGWHGKDPFVSRLAASMHTMRIDGEGHRIIRMLTSEIELRCTAHSVVFRKDVHCS